MGIVEAIMHQKMIWQCSANGKVKDYKNKYCLGHKI